MTDQSMRDDFEAWAAKDGFNVTRAPAPFEYDMGSTATCWRVWQAATRQALERAAKACVKGDADDCAAAIRALEG